MARLTLDELLTKNLAEIDQQEENVRQAQNKLKKLKHKRKELLQRKAEENEQNMLEQLNQLNIKDPNKLQKILEQYYSEQLASNSEIKESGPGAAFDNAENSEFQE